jgi:DNA-binding CsgD family transcriptional regulator
MKKYLLSKADANKLLDLIHACFSCRHVNEFLSLISRLNNLIPFEHAVFAMASLSSNCVQSYRFVDYASPPGWLEHYSNKNYQRVDPLVKVNFNNWSLQRWSDTFTKYEAGDELLYTMDDFGLNDGYACGLPTRHGNGGSFFSFSDLERRRDDRTEKILNLITPHLHQALDRALGTGTVKTTQENLSQRELEVLKFLGCGKNTWDTALILGISERTVNFHIGNIKNKLGAINRSHAVAIGITNGLIDLF